MDTTYYGTTRLLKGIALTNGAGQFEFRHFIGDCTLSDVVLGIDSAERLAQDILQRVELARKAVSQ